MTDREAKKRTDEWMPKTGLPENFWITRLYQHGSRANQDIEAIFHRLINAAGHERSGANRSSKEWFKTNLEFLDTIAVGLGCNITKNDPPEE